MLENSKNSVDRCAGNISETSNKFYSQNWG